jgi:hypothetical protein
MTFSMTRLLLVVAALVVAGVSGSAPPASLSHAAYAAPLLVQIDASQRDDPGPTQPCTYVAPATPGAHPASDTAGDEDRTPLAVLAASNATVCWSIRAAAPPPPLAYRHGERGSDGCRAPPTRSV